MSFSKSDALTTLLTIGVMIGSCHGLTKKNDTSRVVESHYAVDTLVVKRLPVDTVGMNTSKLYRENDSLKIVVRSLTRMYMLILFKQKMERLPKFHYSASDAYDLNSGEDDPWPGHGAWYISAQKIDSLWSAWRGRDSLLRRWYIPDTNAGGMRKYGGYMLGRDTFLGGYLFDTTTSRWKRDTFTMNTWKMQMY